MLTAQLEAFFLLLETLVNFVLKHVYHVGYFGVVLLNRAGQ